MQPAAEKAITDQRFLSELKFIASSITAKLHVLQQREISFLSFTMIVIANRIVKITSKEIYYP